MRLVFACQGCGARYLPPEGLKYPDGTVASAVWCSPCHAAAAAQGITEPPQLAAIALLAAVHAMTAALTARQRRTDMDDRPDRRPSRPARTLRGQLRPRGARTKLR